MISPVASELYAKLCTYCIKAVECQEEGGYCDEYLEAEDQLLKSRTCLNCIHYKSVKCELYGWVERMGNFGNMACTDWGDMNAKGESKDFKPKE